MSSRFSNASAASPLETVSAVIALEDRADRVSHALIVVGDQYPSFVWRSSGCGVCHCR